MSIKNEIKHEMKQNYTINIIQIKEILRDKVQFNVGRLITSIFSCELNTVECSLWKDMKENCLFQSYSGQSGGKMKLKCTHSPVALRLKSKQTQPTAGVRKTTKVPLKSPQDDDVLLRSSVSSASWWSKLSREQC